MQEKKLPKVSLRQIAAAAGVSKTTVSYVLRGCPGPAQKARVHVWQVARQLGYVEDVRISSWMAQVRKAKEIDLVPIAWLDTNKDSDAWQKYKFLTPYIEGARTRALQLGYCIEMISGSGRDLSMRRLAQIVYQRGIEAVIVTQFTRHVRFRWDSLAAVALEGGVIAPRLHQVKTDPFYNLQLAIKMLKRFGYKRIGICLEQEVDRNSYHSVRMAAHYFQTIVPKAERIPPLFYAIDWKSSVRDSSMERQVMPWALRYRPEVIVGHSNLLEEWLLKAGFRVPEDMGIVHLATDDDVADWAGIRSKRKEIGAAAVELVVSLLQNRQFGLPETPRRVEIRGVWQYGRTLLVPKPK